MNETPAEANALGANDPDFAAAANDFGFRLLHALAVAQPHNTLLISPFSIAAALAMTRNGAAGATATAMRDVLGWQELDLPALNASAHTLIAGLLAADPAVTLKIANSLWPATTFALNPEFAARVGAAFHATIMPVDYTRADAAAIINAWVAEQTAQMISELLTPADLSGAIMALVNAIYFNGAWQFPFDPRRTAPHTFHTAAGLTVDTPFMQQTRRWQYATVDGVRVVWLPFGAGSIGMVLALPPADAALAGFQNGMNLRMWERWLAAFDEQQGVVMLPRLAVSARADLAAELKQMGMAIAFTGKADFRHMGEGPLLISKVVHEARLEVNEEGAAATAATAVVMARGMAVPGFNLVFDRPFFAAVYDLSSTAILFAGYVCAPTEA